MLLGPPNPALELSALAEPAAGRAVAACPLAEDVTLLFDELRSPLLRYVLSMGLPVQDGEEVIQEVFLALFQHLRKGKPRDNLRGWLFRVAHHLALKRQYRRREPGLALGPSAAAQPAPGPNPEEALATKERQHKLLAIVSALPETDRCCLHLRTEGLRYREIASVLGISLGSVALSLGRSLARLSTVR